MREDETAVALTEVLVQDKRPRVLVNIYDLADLESVNRHLFRVGLGVYHSGVVLGRREYGYGFKPGPGTGVFYVVPGCAPNAVLRQTLDCGPVEVSAGEARLRLRRLCGEFRGDAYHLLDRNCNTFTAAVVWELTGRELPAWVNRTARFAGVFRCLLPESMVQPQSVPQARMLTVESRSASSPSAMDMLPSRPDAVSDAEEEEEQEQREQWMRALGEEPPRGASNEERSAERRAAVSAGERDALVWDRVRL
ncbi:hypothetical protein CDCA_CDCA06G1995 [Cyanidium caldarium]|uniref:PPPDE domain-containing protein n=1 Tax=Cyanidium caldarium TaxID=2771 RepID=A0AAV9IUJ3_CYACA|nr:hypothetical protein CDCA_CDCA06G1995 [Cyanidium caldarium]